MAFPHLIYMTNCKTKYDSDPYNNKGGYTSCALSERFVTLTKRFVLRNLLAISMFYFTHDE